MDMKGLQWMTYFRLIEVKGPQSDIIQINRSERVSISNTNNINGSEGFNQRHNQNIFSRCFRSFSKNIIV